MRDEGRWPGGRGEDEEEEEVEQVEDWSESSPAGSTETTEPREHTRRNQHRFQFRLLAQQARERTVRSGRLTVLTGLAALQPSTTCTATR